MKKIIAVFLSAVLLFSLCAVPAAAAPTIKATRSYKSGYTLVTLTCSGCTLYYTTDGSKPDSKDRKYTEKLKVTKPTTLRVTAYKNGKRVAGIRAEIEVRTTTPKAELLKQTEEYALYSVSASKNASVYYTTDGSTPSKSNGKKCADGDQIKIKESCTLKLAAYRSGWKKSKIRSVSAVGKSLTQDEFAEEVLRLVNQEREKKGLKALKYNASLQKAAQLRAEELPRKFDHVRPDGTSCFTVLKKFGVSYYAAGENIAAGQKTPEKVVESWMNSPGHRQNILGNYSYLGVGFYKGGSYGYYWAQIFTA